MEETEGSVVKEPDWSDRNWREILSPKRASFLYRDILQYICIF